MSELKVHGHGGARPGAGRKPKQMELKLIERLSPYDDIALAKLGELVEMGDFNAIKLFLSYRFGQPVQRVESDNTVNISNIRLTDLVEFDEVVYVDSEDQSEV